jgi:hypothetical protein
MEGGRKARSDGGGEDENNSAPIFHGLSQLWPYRPQTCSVRVPVTRNCRRTETFFNPSEKSTATDESVYRKKTEVRLAPVRALADCVQVNAHSRAYTMWRIAYSAHKLLQHVTVLSHSSETWVPTYKTALCHNHEGHDMNIHRRLNLRLHYIEKEIKSLCLID